MAVYEIPLSGYPEQFEVEINGTTYIMRVRWNHELNRWVLDLGRSATDWLIRNLALVAGQNLLEQYESLGLGFELHIQCNGKPDDEAAFDNFGVEAHLYAVTA